ncbi:MAG TPA: phosphotransferase, partial [Ktedonobacteraceae bacterium]|nr:phosphotransferase [Ktedonobacteraceae bacterium]
NLRFKSIEDEQHSVYAVDNHSLRWSPPENARWMGSADLTDIALSVPEHRVLLEGWFDEVEHGNIPAKRVPWARIGWFDGARAWIEEQVAWLGYTMVAPIEQVHARVWSTVLRISTTEGVLYFKAVAPGFAHEPGLTQYLSAHWPGCVPHVLTVDTEQRWMLMKDAGRPLRELLLQGDTLANSVYLEQAFTRYAQFQIETADHMDALLSCGCPDRRLHMLPSLFERLIADSPVLLTGQRGGITDAELAQLRNFTPSVREMCDELESYQVPETLHHDDFHTNNILINKSGYVFFDWGDSAITHPFCSMFAALRSAKYRLQYDDDMLLRLRDAYLEPWSSFASHLSRERLLAAFSIAQRLAMLSRALTWYQVVSPLEERVKWEYEDTVPYWLKMFLMNREPDEM